MALLMQNEKAVVNPNENEVVNQNQNGVVKQYVNGDVLNPSCSFEESNSQINCNMFDFFAILNGILIQI